MQDKMTFWTVTAFYNVNNLKKKEKVPGKNVEYILKVIGKIVFLQS
jgi:hypothetical protein